MSRAGSVTIPAASRTPIGVPHYAYRLGPLRERRPDRSDSERGVVATQADTRNSDQVALVGAALAAFVALIVGEGAFGAISTILGLTLALILGAYYRVREWPTTWWDAVLKAAALASVAALSVILTVAFWLQEAVVRHLRVTVDHRKVTVQDWCSGEVINRHTRDVETCIGGQTADHFLWWIWLIAALLVFIVALYYLLREVDKMPRLLKGPRSVIAAWLSRPASGKAVGGRNPARGR